MSVFDYLRRDHRELRLWMKAIRMCESGDCASRLRLFRKLREELLLHVMTEEKIIYLPLRGCHTSQNPIERTLEQNDEIRRMIEKLSQISPSSEQWEQAFSRLEALVLKQFSEEENVLFPQAQELLPRPKLEVLRDAWEDRKQQERAVLAQWRKVA